MMLGMFTLNYIGQIKFKIKQTTGITILTCFQLVQCLFENNLNEFVSCWITYEMNVFLFPIEIYINNLYI